VHGLGGSAANWLALAPLLLPGRRVLVPELPGHGGSDPLPAAASLNAWADRIAGLLDEPAAVVGHSLGGAVALRLAIRRPALVRDDPRPDLDRVQCSTLLLWGARDNQLPVGDAFEYARRLRAPLRAIADCGHLLIGERPEACADAIESFLAQSR